MLDDFFHWVESSDNAMEAGSPSGFIPPSTGTAQGHLPAL